MMTYWISPLIINSLFHASLERHTQIKASAFCSVWWVISLQNVPVCITSPCKNNYFGLKLDNEMCHFSPSFFLIQSFRKIQCQLLGNMLKQQLNGSESYCVQKVMWSPLWFFFSLDFSTGRNWIFFCFPSKRTRCKQKLLKKNIISILIKHFLNFFTA